MINIPIGPYSDFADCVRKNSDKSDPSAYCATIQRQVEGQNMPKKKVVYNGKEYVVIAENQAFTIKASLNKKEDKPSVNTP